MAKEKIDLKNFNNLLDILPEINDSSKNICLLTGTGDGWSEKLAWDPCEQFISNDAESLKKFIKRNQENNNLVIGFIDYDFGLSLQGIKSNKKNDLGLPSIYFYAYDNYAVAANDRLEIHGSKKLNKIIKSRDLTEKLAEPFSLTVSKNDYSLAFDKIKNYIKSGHIYQLNLTHRLVSSTDSHPRDIFYKLAKNNQASMMSYFEGSDFEILSISPERFIKINGKNIYTTPIKGTQAKTNKPSEDINNLLSSKKELSELNMITDLLRNDLSAVCTPGSVKVDEPRKAQTLTNVIHTNSKISGVLYDDLEPIDALLSMFPGGSISGCPKKRAIEIIDELEDYSRGIYCGSMICINPDGDLDSNILIRTIIKKRNELVLPVGGGVVFDSEMEKEFQETLDKAKSLVELL